MGYRKYRAKKVTVDGIKFDSIRESARYLELKMLQDKGFISRLELQPEFILVPAYEYRGQKIRKMSYRADFQYVNRDGDTVVEDVKGFRTKEYALKRKLFLYKFGSEYRFEET